MSALRGKHAVITGAARGIGAAVAERLVGDGATVTLLGRTQSTLTALAERLGSGVAGTVVCDVASSEQVAQVFAQLPPIHLLINNAGQAESAPVTRTTDAQWARMLAVNLTGTFHCTRAVLPGMLSAGWGRIVCVASTASLRGYPYVAAYAAAKHGVVGLTRSLALEVAGKGITVNAVCPGFTDTEMLRESVANLVARTGRTEDEARASLAAFNPQGRFVSPADVAAMVGWLCAPEAAAMTGLAIPVSGGEVM